MKIFVALLDNTQSRSIVVKKQTNEDESRSIFRIDKAWNGFRFYFGWFFKIQKSSLLVSSIAISSLGVEIRKQIGNKINW